MLVTDMADYYEMIEALRAWDGVLAVDTETTGLRPYVRDRIRGISVATDSEAWYLSLSHPGSAHYSPAPLIRQLLTHDLVMHHAKFDWAFLAQLTDDPGIRYRTIWDTQVFQWLDDENMKSGLKPVCERIFGTDSSAEQRHLRSLKGKTWSTYTAEDIAEYAAQDARLTYDLWVWQRAHLGQTDPPVYALTMDREMMVQRALYSMTSLGVRVDQHRLRNAAERTVSDLEASGNIFSEAGVNPDSPKQVGSWLYQTLGYPCTSFTPGGAPSTSRSALEGLLPAPEAAALLDRRLLTKALSGYLLPLQDEVGGDGRVHATFSSTGTVTGRLSCSAPNLQTIPRGDTLPEVRKCFIPRDGWHLYEYDLRGAELRVMAGYSDEGAMSEALVAGRDLHSETAESVFGAGYTPLQRRLAKGLNFGFAYGIGPKKFAESMTAGTPGPETVREAARILAGYREAYPALTRTMRALERVAERDGWIGLGWPGRHRHFWSPGQTVPYYTALNAVVQGGIGEHMKDVMIGWHRAPLDGALLLLQVHDSLVFEVRDAERSVEVHRWLNETSEWLNPFPLPMEWEMKRWE